MTWWPKSSCPNYQKLFQPVSCEINSCIYMCLVWVCVQPYSCWRLSVVQDLRVCENKLWKYCHTNTKKPKEWWLHWKTFPENLRFYLIQALQAVESPFLIEWHCVWVCLNVFVLSCGWTRRMVGQSRSRGPARYRTGTWIQPMTACVWAHPSKTGTRWGLTSSMRSWAQRDTILNISRTSVR